MLFQTNAPEYDKLFLNKLILGLGIRKCLLLTDRKFKVELLFDSLILNKSVRYSGAISDQCLYFARYGVLAYHGFLTSTGMRTGRLVRMGGCSDWSDPLLSTQFICFVFMMQ